MHALLWVIKRESDEFRKSESEMPVWIIKTIAPFLWQGAIQKRPGAQRTRDYLRQFMQRWIREMAGLLPLLWLGLHGCVLDGRGPLLPDYGLDVPEPYALQVPDNFPAPVLSADNPLTVEGIALGRKLFYEELLSGDNTQSCASCHAQAFGFSDHGQQFSTGIDGVQGSANAIALMNLAWMPGYGWDGREQVLDSMVLEEIRNVVGMHEDLAVAVAELQATADYPAAFEAAFGEATVTGDGILRALAQFGATLVSASSDYDKFRRGEPNQFSQAAFRGMDVFFSDRGECYRCHSADLLSDYAYHNNGLDSVFSVVNYGRANVTGLPWDIGRFKTPGLRNVEVSAPYMHDGRFATLEEVVEHYNSGIRVSATLDPEIVKPGGLFLTNQEKGDLVAFLRALTDDGFLGDSTFADPD
jgi:cytochrome c peroxidase